MSELQQDLGPILQEVSKLFWDIRDADKYIADRLTARGYTRTAPNPTQGVISVTIMRGIINGFINQAKTYEDRKVVEEVLAALESMIGVGTGQPPKPARSVTQIAFAANSYGSWPLVLCEDGTLWGMPDGASDNGVWKKLPPIPGDTL